MLIILGNIFIFILTPVLASKLERHYTFGGKQLSNPVPNPNPNPDPDPNPIPNPNPDPNPNPIQARSSLAFVRC